MLAGPGPAPMERLRGHDLAQPVTDEQDLARPSVDLPLQTRNQTSGEQQTNVMHRRIARSALSGHYFRVVY